jgi:hypothetical protein
MAFNPVLQAAMVIIVLQILVSISDRYHVDRTGEKFAGK